jgi:hypothetical protein
VTPKERNRAVDKAQRAELREKVRLLKDADAEIRRILETALGRVRSILAGQPSDYQQWQLPQVEREIERELGGMRNQAQTMAGRAAGAMWQGGIDSIDKPLSVGGFSINGVVPQLSARQLDAMRNFMTDRLRDATADAINQVNTQLGLTVIGVQSPSDAVTQITEILGEKTRDRARTIVAHNLQTVYSTAAQERAEAASKVIAMRKVWRRSGKRKQRPGHALADGQSREIDEPFDIPDADGVIVKMMMPHDPKAPIGETINCGCTALYKPSGWKSTKPDRAPFRADELKDNPQLAQLVKSR